VLVALGGLNFSGGDGIQLKVERRPWADMNFLALIFELADEIRVTLCAAFEFFPSEKEIVPRPDACKRIVAVLVRGGCFGSQIV